MGGLVYNKYVIVYSKTAKCDLWRCFKIRDSRKVRGIEDNSTVVKRFELQIS